VCVLKENIETREKERDMGEKSLFEFQALKKKSEAL